ncbi:hypothetical protein B0H14DRAFT_2610803 [Mycena olivaceomarginata]|nr:hypothetical protein B0H14DRAFT_2610803 [Mycena olivaceomarginata]
MWIKTATPRTGMEQGQKNTGKGKKGKKAKPEKVLMPVDKNLAVFGCALRGTGICADNGIGHSGVSEKYVGRYKASRRVTWLFFTCLTLVYTGFCTTATNDIHCVLDSIWRHLGRTANFNSSFQIHSSVVHILPSEYEKKPADLNQQVGGHLGAGRVCRDTQGEKMWELGEMKENRAIIRKLQYRGRRAGQRTVIQSSGGHVRPGVYTSEIRVRLNR